MKVVIITIGIPGSGKTTLLRPLAEEFCMQRISRDDIREEWFGDPILQVHKKEVWEEAERRTREYLKAGQSVILDSTFTDPIKRKDVIDFARNAGADRIIGIVFTTSFEEAKKQNNNREVVVPENVLELMYKQLTEDAPSLNEGFDALYTYEELNELKNKELGGS